MSQKGKEANASPEGWRKWIGLGLVLLSGVWFGCIFVVPFTGFSLAAKAVLGTVFFLLMEGTFYLGLFLVGRQLLSRYWRSIRLKLRLSPHD
jgi:hypothetical protein